ncbi:MAG: RNA-binding S4 domain-containing protein [Proteobacteria bacterium]|nr:RNA-binding S4 domain-containing protein [Pseudomonadota bacterium]
MSGLNRTTDAAAGRAQVDANDGQRLDKWLWAARFFKSRTAASALCAAGKIRMSGRVISKAHVTVRVGDVLTFPLGRHIRVVRVLALAVRRGPAPEARALYEDLNPVPGAS